MSRRRALSVAHAAMATAFVVITCLPPLAVLHAHHGWNVIGCALMLGVVAGCSGVIELIWKGALA